MLVIRSVETVMAFLRYKRGGPKPRIGRYYTSWCGQCGTSTEHLTIDGWSRCLCSEPKFFVAAVNSSECKLRWKEGAYPERSVMNEDGAIRPLSQMDREGLAHAIANPQFTYDTRLLAARELLKRERPIR